MIGNDRPPLRPKKGLKIVQSPQYSKKFAQQALSSADGSTNSISRTRGISISRETGINIDKIYDLKHFLPSKPTQKEQSKSTSNAGQTISTVRSLKLISVFAESKVQNGIFSEKQIQELGLNGATTELEQQKQEKRLIRCNSPILKLANTSGSEFSEDQKVQIKSRPNIINF